MTKRIFVGTSRLFWAVTLLHLLLGLRLTQWYEPWGVWEWGVWVLLACTSTSIVMGMRRRGRVETPGQRAVLWVGYTALGLFSSLSVLTVARDAVLLGAWVVGFSWDGVESWTSVCVVGGALAMSVIGFINAVRLAQVKHVKVEVEGLAEELEGFTIAQLSDIHVGPLVRRRQVEKIVERVNGLGADLVAITGDVVDGSVNVLREQTEPLGRIRSRHGTALVIGNHELYSGAEEWIDEFRRLGARVLLNEHLVVRKGSGTIVVAGITDHTTAAFVSHLAPDARKALVNAPDEQSTRVLLAHQPRSMAHAEGMGFDLMLCGHTHGGQFAPWNFFVPIQQPLVAGLHRMMGMWVYVHRGTCFWGPPKRLFAPAEIALVKLCRARG